MALADEEGGGMRVGVDGVLKPRTETAELEGEKPRTDDTALRPRSVGEKEPPKEPELWLLLRW